MTYLDLTSSQAAALARDGVVERWVTWEKQPPKRFKHAVVITNGERYGLSYAPSFTGMFQSWPPKPKPGLLPRHPPGTRARVREPWAAVWVDSGDQAVVYTDRSALVPNGDGTWAQRVLAGVDMVLITDSMFQPASTMPDSAIRTEAVCKSVTPDQRGEWGFVERWEKC